MRNEGVRGSHPRIGVPRSFVNHRQCASCVTGVNRPCGTRVAAGWQQDDKVFGPVASNPRVQSDQPGAAGPLHRTTSGFGLRTKPPCGPRASASAPPGSPRSNGRTTGDSCASRSRILLHRSVTAGRTRRLAKDVDGDLELAVRRGRSRCDPLVARPLELVKTGPMCWEIRRLEHVDHHVLARAVQDDSGKAVVGSPTGIDESAANVAAEPTTVERAHVMVIRTARSQRSIRGEPVFSGQCAWVDHADILTSVPGPRPHAVWESASRRGGTEPSPEMAPTRSAIWRPPLVMKGSGVRIPASALPETA